MRLWRGLCMYLYMQIYMYRYTYMHKKYTKRERRGPYICIDYRIYTHIYVKRERKTSTDEMYVSSQTSFSLFIYMCVYIDISVHICYINLETVQRVEYVSLCMAFSSLYVCICVCVCACVRMQVRVYLYIYACLYMYVHM